MKILYLSCHSILEYDEVKLLSEMGFEVFSHGAYTNPVSPGDPKRPGFKGYYNQEFSDIAIRYSKDNLHPKMLAWADTVICMHIVDWLITNETNFSNQRVIWRSIGQSTLNVENLLRPLRMRGLEIVRYSPRERTIPGYAGEDRIIRFYKDPDEFSGWTGEEARVLTIGQSMKHRSQYCGFEVFDRVTQGMPRMLIGPGNEDAGDMAVGVLSYERMKENLRKSRVYFYTGTYPASYTLNFIEAFITGIPVVALGPRLGNSPHEIGQKTYEIPDIIENGINGFVSDDIEELRYYCRRLLDDKSLARRIGEEGRKTAIDLFAKNKIKDQWKEYLYG